MAIWTANAENRALTAVGLVDVKWMADCTSRAEKPICERIGDRSARTHHGQGHETSEYGKAFDAIGVSARQPLQEGRKTGIVRCEAIRGNAAAHHKMGAQDLHPYKQ